MLMSYSWKLSFQFSNTGYNSMFILHNSNNTSVQEVIPVDFPVENSCSQTSLVNIALCAFVCIDRVSG